MLESLNEEQGLSKVATEPRAGEKANHTHIHEIRFWAKQLDRERLGVFLRKGKKLGRSPTLYGSHLNTMPLKWHLLS